MRHRNVKGAYEKLELHPKVIHNPESYKGKWKSLFNNEHPIYIEIGMGKGQFLINHAKLHKDRNYIGFEKFSAVLAKGLEKIDEEENLDNVYVIREDAENILDFFGEDELDGLYLNFSDPWPKDRHAKRRLTHANFLEKYRMVLKKGSSIILKTDNLKLFEFSVEQMKMMGLDIVELTDDLYNSPSIETNIATEYEDKFVAQGLKINRVHAIIG
jgi:tRNA (guanine-N7-)-methyltransferase